MPSDAITTAASGSSPTDLSTSGAAARSEAGPGNVLIADASRVSPGRFMARARSMFAPAQTAASEKADAAKLFISLSWGKSREEVERLRAEFETAKLEIDSRYAVERDLLFTMELQNKARAA